MAVAAGDAGVIHAALQERTPDIDLIALLSIDVIQTLRQQRRTVKIEVGRSGPVALGDLTAPRMALRADLNLGLGRAGAAAHRLAGRRIDGPAHAAALGEGDGQTLRCVL